MDSTTSDEGEKEKCSEVFDYLVVASGFFSSPFVPDIPGLSDFKGRVIHSSVLDDPDVLPSVFPGHKAGKLLVIGGSMSGAEAASSLAFHLSALKYTPSPRGDSFRDCEVHHVCSKPFWTIPMYLPQTDGSDEVSFLPLDLVMYNLGRRSPGPVEYSFGPLSAEQITKTNNVFRSLLGNAYETYGHIKAKHDGQNPQPTFVAIGNDYAEFVRSKAISPTVGRVHAIHDSGSGQASVDITLPDGQTTSLDNVAAIITATGFTPHPSLSFLPDDILSVLEYSATDSYIPLVLDSRGSMHSHIPRLGFVGFYKGPYWGAMEMQARSLGQAWSTRTSTDETEAEQKRKERASIRVFRNADPRLCRAQLPMGDYTGLMESFARELRIPRAQLVDSNPEKHGPVVPARYAFNPSKEQQVETTKTLADLRVTLICSPGPGPSPNYNQNQALAVAVFRGLHGTWAFTRTYRDRGIQTPRTVSGKISFHPRWPSDPVYEREYFCEDFENSPGGTHPMGEYNSRSEYAYSLSQQLGSDHTIRCESEDGSHGLVISSARVRMRDGERAEGQCVVHASGEEEEEGREGSAFRYEYAFHFEGVEITAWECRAVDISPGIAGTGVRAESVYRR